jgi:ribosomal protein S18 acetylase RimI-like enzyme
MVARPATARDLAQIVELGLRADVTEHELLPDIAARKADARRVRRYWKRGLRDRRSRTVVAARGSAVLGMVTVELRTLRNRHSPVRRYVYVHSLFIAPAARRAHLGTRLTRIALDWGRRRGATQARLEMAAPNRGARRLYESLGFELRELMFARPL